MTLVALVMTGFSPSSTLFKTNRKEVKDEAQNNLSGFNPTEIRIVKVDLSPM